jgi:hypothetical protein
MRIATTHFKTMQAALKELEPIARDPKRLASGRPWKRLEQRPRETLGNGGMNTMSHILLLGAGFSRNWGAPLASEITGSLLGELHDDADLAGRLRRGPFEDAFAGFQPPRGQDENAVRVRRLQDAVTGLFGRMNKALESSTFEFRNETGWTVREFLEKFDAIFTLNQDLLLEMHYWRHVSQKWNDISIPGMRPDYGPGHAGGHDPTKLTWQPNGENVVPVRAQPYFKLHGSSNWKDAGGEPVLIMGSAKSGAIDRFPVLRWYHEKFKRLVGRPGARMMVIGYSFQDEHINQVICDASTRTGLGTFLVDPAGRDVLKDPKMARAAIQMPRDVESIRIVGELKRPLSSIFSNDAFAHGELMRFFQ